MKNLIFGALSLIALTFVSCSDDNDNISGGTATMEVRLVDGPADYDAVNIDVQDVEISTENGWVNLNMPNPGVYNLLEFKNGLDNLLLGQAVLPVGHVSQMRLILGSNNSIVVNGVTHPLQTPSAMQSGLKFNWNETLVANGAYNVWIDFDAAKSIVEQGNGGYLLKPVIRTFSEATNGQIKGYVLPQAANSLVHVINSTNDTIATTIPEQDGFYMFMGLPQANYTVSFDADDATGYLDENQTSVGVTFGQITDLGIKTLVQ